MLKIACYVLCNSFDLSLKLSSSKVYFTSSMVLTVAECQGQYKAEKRLEQGNGNSFSC